ncbi:MAG TPA: helix-turn-helix transcriptional regulator, partial [Acidocella sp.]|nr:helix-turn-helix transcriptional regulator [Acidocella sp.]
MTISKQLRRAIVVSGLSCYRIAQLSGVSEAALSRFMSRQRGLALASVDRLADVLGLQLTVKGEPPCSSSATPS